MTHGKLIVSDGASARTSGRMICACGQSDVSVCQLSPPPRLPPPCMHAWTFVRTGGTVIGKASLTQCLPEISSCCRDFTWGSCYRPAPGLCILIPQLSHPHKHRDLTRTLTASLYFLCKPSFDFWSLSFSDVICFSLMSITPSQARHCPAAHCRTGTAFRCGHRLFQGVILHPASVRSLPLD